MVLERIPPDLVMVELLDRVLDKGIVFDTATRVSAAGIHFLTMESQVIVASVDTYLQHAPHANGVRADQRRVLELSRVTAP